MNFITRAASMIILSSVTGCGMDMGFLGDGDDLTDKIVTPAKASRGILFECQEEINCDQASALLSVLRLCFPEGHPLVDCLHTLIKLNRSLLITSDGVSFNFSPSPPHSPLNTQRDVLSPLNLSGDPVGGTGPRGSLFASSTPPSAGVKKNTSVLDFSRQQRAEADRKRPDDASMQLACAIINSENIDPVSLPSEQLSKKRVVTPRYDFGGDPRSNFLGCGE
ncbi:MAG: hypothetical protein NTX76_04025 [Alphaproteobacteria bacterium]|nr:hypothetical protein [Alphaproteobacteria bacterium]